MNIENMGGRDQSQVKIKFKKFKKVKSVPSDVPKSHNDDKEKGLLRTTIDAIMRRLPLLGKDHVVLLNRVRATLPPSTLFADRALLRRGYSISEPNV